MKLLMIILSFITLLRAQQVQISADHLEADEKKMRSILTGHVFIKKGSDEIHTEKLTVYFDKKNRPTKYLATGNITFQIHTNNQSFEGHAHKLLYNPDTKIYAISGDAFIYDKKLNRKLYGESIMIDRRSGKSTINGSPSQPVKFIFEVKEH